MLFNSMKAFYKILLYWVLSILLIVSIMSYGTYLIKNNYIVECFQAVDLGSPETSHNVDQPINTTFTCKNMCGPLARCSITGEQCTSDVDCFGCVPKITETEVEKYGPNIRGENDAGKLTAGMTPDYSPLTTDIGTKAAFVSASGELEKPPQYDQGTDIWKTRFNNGYKFFNQRYRPPKDLPYEPTYPDRMSLSGEFMDDGPLPSNSYLQK